MNLRMVGIGLSLGILVWETQDSRADATEGPMPPAASAILTQMDKEIVAAKLKSIGSLDKVLKDTTKKGDLAGAMAVKETIDQLKRETQATARSGPGRVNATAIVGRWQGSGLSMEFFPDGTVKAATGTGGTWQADGKTVEVTWDHRYRHRLKMTPQGLVGTRISPSGQEQEEVSFAREK